jgi:hypothetical protein
MKITGTDGGEPFLQRPLRFVQECMFGAEEVAGVRHWDYSLAFQ